jgi:hypothetical protein
MRVWVEDLTFQLARALRVVGIGLAAVAWASVIGSEAQQTATADTRAYAQVAAAIVAVIVAQWFTGLPPSANAVDLIRPFERDIVAAARDRAGGDVERMQMLAARIATLAVVRIRRGANLPRDRRAWLRALAHLAED